VDERWVLRDSGPVRSELVEDMLNGRIAAGELTTWLESTVGRTIGLVTNGTRAMLVLMEYEGDAGFHAVDPSATDDTQGGYVLDNGQVDIYADRDTVPLPEALYAMAVLVRTGELDDRISWRCDR
jgi:hypothetical protein